MSPSLCPNPGDMKGKQRDLGQFSSPSGPGPSGSGGHEWSVIQIFLTSFKMSDNSCYFKWSFFFLFISHTQTPRWARSLSHCLVNIGLTRDQTQGTSQQIQIWITPLPFWPRVELLRDCGPVTYGQ